MVKMDAKDRKILYQLDINSRQSNSEIARKVGISKQVVGFRIRRLIRENVLSQFHAVIDISKLGFAIHKNFLRLQNIGRGKEAELLAFLKSNPNVVWLASCDGRYDLAFGIWAKDMEHLDRSIKEFGLKFGQFVLERQIASIIRGEYFVRNYLAGESAVMRKSFFGAVPEKTKIDDIDWKILFELGKNARVSSSEISVIAGIGAEAVGDRIRKLEKSGIIRHYNIVPNESVYPYLHYKVLVGLRNLTDRRENALDEFCRRHPNIVYIVKAFGPWDFEIDIEAENMGHFREIMMELKTNFSDIIKDYSALHIYQVHKYNFCPSVHTLS